MTRISITETTMSSDTIQFKQAQDDETWTSRNSNTCCSPGGAVCTEWRKWKKKNSLTILNFTHLLNSVLPSTFLRMCHDRSGTVQGCIQTVGGDLGSCSQM